MILIRPSYEILSPIDGPAMLKAIELAGRTCYKSEDKITDNSAEAFVKMLISRGHESVLEHEKITVKFTCDRGVSHELVRHRIASFSQESTRYCNYTNLGITFVIPNWIPTLPEGSYDILSEHVPHVERDSADEVWFNNMLCAEEDYLMLIKKGWRPEQARSVLPNSLKTEIVVTANLREWRLIFTQRTAKTAHPQMRELMIPLCKELALKLPIIFDVIES